MAKILVTMPDSFLSRVDGFADGEKLSRSELIREALKSYMRKLSPSQSENASKTADKLESLIG